MNDCITCFESLNYKGYFSNYKTYLLLQEEFKEDIQQIKEEKLPQNINLPIIFSDSLYRLLGHFDISTFHVLKNNKEVFYCSLREMPTKLNELYKIFKNPECDSIKIISKIPHHLKTAYHNNTLTINNQTFREIFIENSFKNYKIKNNPRLSSLNYYLNLDSAEVDRAMKYCINSNTTVKGRIEDMYLDEDTLYFIIQNNYPVDTLFEGRKDTMILSIFSLVKFYDDKLISIYPIQNVYFNSGYSFVQDCFFVHNGVPYFSMQNNNRDDKQKRFLAKWKLLNGKYILAEFIEFELPIIHKENKLDYNFSDFEIKWPYLMNSISNTLYNLEDKSTKELQIDIGKSDFSDMKHFRFKLNFGIADICYKNDTLKVLAMNNGYYYIYKILLSKNKLLNKTILVEGLENIDFACKPKFKDFKTVYYIKHNSQYLHFIKSDN